MRGRLRLASIDGSYHPVALHVVPEVEALRAKFVCLLQVEVTIRRRVPLGEFARANGSFGVSLRQAATHPPVFRIITSQIF